MNQLTAIFGEPDPAPLGALSLQRSNPKKPDQGQVDS
jgi:hypothetical protein